MTRVEITGRRCLTFSQWIREKLPDSSTGFSASDLDFILWNWKTKKVMMLEIKTRNCEPRIGQKMMWQNLNKWMRRGIDDGWTYLGFNLIVFEKKDFDDGKCYLNNEEITEEKLITLLSLED